MIKHFFYSCFFKDNHQKVWLFRRLLYLFLLYYSSILLLNMDLLQTYHINKLDLVNVGLWFPVNWLQTYFSNYLGIAIGFQLIFLIGGLAGYRPKLFGFLIWFLTINIFNSIHLITNAGEDIVASFLFFFLFMNEKKRANKLITNLFLLVCQFQLCLVYIVAGFSKLLGTEWLAGNGLFYSLNYEFFSSPLAQKTFLISPYIYKPLGWLMLFYQVFFVIFIFIKPLKNYWLLLGVVFHLSTIFLMGLVDFGSIMLISYILLLDNKKINVFVKLIPSYTHL